MNDAHTIQSELKSLGAFSLELIQSPARAIQNIPEVQIPALFIFQNIVAMVAGIICGSISGTFLSVIGNMFLHPLQIFFLNSLITVLILFLVRWKFEKDLDRMALYRLVMICQLPLVCLRSLNAFEIPVDVIGFGIMTWLLNRSLAFYFDLPRGKVQKGLKTAYLIYFIFASTKVFFRIREEYHFQKSLKPTHVSSQQF